MPDVTLSTPMDTFLTGGGLTFTAATTVGNTITSAANQPLALVAGAGNQNITLTPSGTGGVFVAQGNGSLTIWKTASNSNLYLSGDGTTANGGRIGYNAGTANLEIAARSGFSTVLSAGVATPAGGSTSARVMLGTTSGLGIYYGSGAPSVSAAQGSLYIRSDGSGIADRLYVNTNGTIGWTNFVSAS